jgi:hypothetical protein
MTAARVAFRGTHPGAFQGIPPTDKEVAFSSMEFNRVVDGKVEEHWVELDLFGLMRQLGAIPEPEHSQRGESYLDDESNFREAAVFTQARRRVILRTSPMKQNCGKFSEVRTKSWLAAS